MIFPLMEHDTWTACPLLALCTHSRWGKVGVLLTAIPYLRESILASRTDSVNANTVMCNMFYF